MPSCAYHLLLSIVSEKGQVTAKKKTITLIDPEFHLDNEGIMVTLAFLQYFIVTSMVLFQLPSLRQLL